MAYEISYKKSAAKALGKLEKTVANRLLDAIEALGSNPRPQGCTKLVDGAGAYRIRVGDYRIVYEIDDGRVTVLVLALGHRRDIYA